MVNEISKTEDFRFINKDKNPILTNPNLYLLKEKGFNLRMFMYV